MPRAHLREVITDEQGYAIVNALCSVYLHGTTTAVTDMYTVEAGGVPVATLTSDDVGVIEGWFTSKKEVDILIADNNGSAYLSIDSPTNPISFTPYTVEIEVHAPPSTAGEVDIDQNFTGQLLHNGVAVASDTAVVHNTGDEAVQGIKTFQNNAYFKGGDPWVDVKAFGAVGDGANDDFTNLQAAATAAAGKTLFFPAGGTFRCLTTLVIPPNTTVMGSGAKLFNATTATTVLSLGSGCSVYGLEIYNNGSAASYNDASRCISIIGTVGSYLTDIRLINCYLHGASYGLWAEFVQRIWVERPKVYDIAYIGIMGSSINRMYVTDPDIDMNNPVGTSGNAYGITFTRVQESLVNRPRSTNWGVKGGMVKNCPLWAGIDTHGGQYGSIMGTRILNCGYGVNISPSNNASSVSSFAPKHITVDVVVDSTVTNGSAQSGVLVAGAASVENAEGITVRGVIKGHGLENVSTDAGLNVRDTTSFRADVTCIECSPGAVIMRGNNAGFLLNVISQDAWSTAGTSRHIYINASNNAGSIGAHQLLHASKSATSLNAEGIRVDNLSGNDVELHAGYNTATTPIVDAGKKLHSDVNAVLTVANSLQVKGPSPWADVKAFGAKGDGTTDDTAAIQAAIDSVNSGGVVQFPNGTYKITSSLKFYSGVILRGSGQDQTTINGAIGSALVRSNDTTVRSYRVQIRDLTIDNTSSATSGGIGLDFTRVSQGGCLNVAIKNVQTGLKLSNEAYYNDFYTLDIIGATTGINSIAGANENHWFGGRVSTTTTAVIFDNSSGSYLSGVAIEGFTTGVSVSPTAACVYCKITNCRFEGGTTGVLVGALSQTTYITTNQYTSVSTAVTNNGVGTTRFEEEAVQFGNSGTLVKKHIHTTATVDFGSISANSAVDSPLQTVTGASVNSVVIVNAPSALLPGGLVVSGTTTTDGVYIRMANVTTSPIDPPSMTFQITVFVY